MMLNVLLLVVCILIAIGSLLYIFYWNRLVGALLGLLIRLAYWNQESTSIWVEFGSVHFSILAGRILFKDLRYHSSNQSVRIANCQFSWRYWIRRTAEEEDFNANYMKGEGLDGKQNRMSVPCRIHITVKGLEWFLYNRTASFEDILSHISPNEPPEKSRSRSGTYSTDAFTSPLDKAAGNGYSFKVTSRRSNTPVPSRISRAPAFMDGVMARIKRQLPHLDPKNLLPFSFEATTAAIIIGNHSTESLIIVQFSSAQGTYGIVQSRSKLDLYKTMLRVKLHNAAVTCVENRDHWDSMLMIGKDVCENVVKSQSEQVPRPMSAYLTFGAFHQFWHHCKANLPYLKRKKSKFASSEKSDKKKSSKRYEDDTHVGADFSTLEYAIDRKLLEAPVLELTYYADVAGLVPDSPPSVGSRTSDQVDIGNGDPPPEWGADLVLHGGFIRYGPWADRQRAELQRAFFPSTFHHITPTAPLRPGDERTCISLNIFIEFRGSISLLAPLREASKNWQWDGKVDVPRVGKHREAATILLRAGDSSTVKYVVPMIATEEGYNTTLDIYMNDISVTSSVNDIQLVNAHSCNVSGQLPTPLNWDSERQWTFNLSLHRPVLYLIRDHINLFIDLGKDWSAGPPSNFHTFVPTIYALKLDLIEYELNLYANDHNIIDRPLDREDNALFTLRGPSLRVNATLPSNKYRPESTTVSFSVKAPDVAVSLTLPRWNTHTLYANHGLTNIGRFASLDIDASFLYFAQVREEYVDCLKVVVKASSPAFKFFGWAIRHVLVLRDNYFGTFTNFSTTREYSHKRESKLPIGDPMELKYRKGNSNVFQVDLTVQADNTILLLPAGLPGFEKVRAILGKQAEATGLGSCVMYHLPESQAQIRLHDYYMEISLNIDPLGMSVMDDCPDGVLFGDRKQLLSKEVLSIDGIDITANRLFGPQPRTATYICLWEIHVGDVRCAMTATQGQVFLKAKNTFSYNFSDPFNAPSSDYALPPDPDATFLKVVVDTVDCVWLAPSAAMRLTLPNGLHFDSNNVAGTLYRKVISANVEEVAIQILSASHTKRRWLEAGALHFAISLDLYSSPKGWTQDAEAQRKFLLLQDSQTMRAQEFTGVGVPDLPGKGVWRNSLYLPKVSLPQAAPRYGAISPDQRGPRSHAQTKSHRARHTAQISESDEENNISELDRDSRLAQSRPTHLSTPMLQERDDRNLTSGDESDEAGSIASRQSWSDSDADEDDEINMQIESSFLRYWNLSRHYTMRQDCPPSDWISSSFSLVQDSRPLRTALPSVIMSNPRPHSPLSSGPAHFDDLPQDEETPDLDMSLLRLTALQEVQIFATPLLTGAGSTLLEEFYNSIISPELQIDALTSLVVQSVSPRPSKLCLDLTLQTIRISLIQDLMSMEESFAFMTSDQEVMKSAHPSSPRLVSAVELVISDVHIIGAIPLHMPPSTMNHISTKVEIDKMTLLLGTMLASSNPDKNEMALTPSTIVQFDLGMTIVAMSHEKMALNLDAACLRFHHSAPEMVIATTNGVRTSVMTLVRAWKEASIRCRVELQYLVRDIINCPIEKTTRHLLSAIQPSFLVQTGRPDQLRQNFSWKFLFQLRDTLRSLDHEDHPNRRSYVWGEPGLSTADIDSILEERSIAWTIDGEKFSSAVVLILQDLYDKPGSSDQKGAWVSPNLPIKSFSFECAPIQFIYEDINTASQSNVGIGPIFARIEVFERELQILVPLGVSSNRPAPTREKAPNKLVLSLTTVVTIDDIQIIIFPNVIPFLQHFFHVQRVFKTQTGHESHTKDRGNNDSNAVLQTTPTPLSFELQFSIRQLRMQAVAENIIFDLTIAGFSSSIICHVSKSLKASTRYVQLSQAITFDEFCIKARERLYADAKSKLHDVLAAIIVSRGLLSGFYQQDVAPRGTVHVQKLQLSVPRSALRLYHFLDEWREDYLSGIDSMMQSLFTEIRSTAKESSETSSSRQATTHFPPLQLQASLTTFVVTLQVMHSTWLSWQVSDTVAYMRSTSITHRGPSYAFGVQLLAQVISVASTSGQDLSIRPTFSKASLSLELPSLRMSGSYDADGMHALASLDFFRVKVKPTHWDAVLSVQQKFGSDFNDLLLLIADTRRKRAGNIQKRGSSPSSKPLLFSISGRLKGFRIALEGPSSTQFLECEDIDGALSNIDGREWNIDLSDLAVSLSPKVAKSEAGPAFNRLHRSAFVTLDLHANNRASRDVPKRSEQTLNIAVTKLHAVLQPSSIGEVGDFIDHLQAELLVRKEQRALELSAFKEKAKIVMRTFNVMPHPTSTSDRSTIFGNRTILVAVTNIGAAFPLTLDQNFSLNHSTGNQDTLSVKAFLFSIKSFSFSTHRGETGEAVMDAFSFMFVSRFRQSVSSDFSGETHQTRNRLIYPKMTAHVQATTSPSSRQLCIGASISGFILDLDSSITNYVFSLIDVYRHGKSRMERMATGWNTTDTPSSSQPSENSMEAQYHAIPTTNVQASLEFLSGEVRMYPEVNIPKTKSEPGSLYDIQKDQISHQGAELFHLPEVSVWCEFRATPASQKLSSIRKSPASQLIFKSTIHSSQNTLHPSLLPFLTEIVHSIEQRMRKSPWHPSRPSSVAIQEAISFSDSHRSTETPNAVVMTSMRINFSLRIDQSKLELTCQPDVNVVAGLHWDSGGFVLNISPGAQRVSMTGSVGGLTAGLKHGFLSEDCARVDARNLTFSVAFSKSGDIHGQVTNSVSIVVDTDFAGGIRFSRLQDLLCFKAVWLDRIPILNGEFVEQASTPSRSSFASPVEISTKQGFATAVIFRARHITLEADLGQAISAVTLDLRSVLVRTRLTEELSEFSMSVANVELLAAGNLSGHASTPDFLFQTVRGRQATNLDKDQRSTMLELTLSSGTLDILLKSDKQWLLQYRAEPIEARVIDDWTLIDPKVSILNRKLRLYFKVVGKKVTALMTVGTIPKLIIYAGKFIANVEAQREGASRESKVFRATRLPKPENALSEVANAMLQSARSKFKETGTLSYPIGQHMSLQLEELVFVLFPRALDDTDIARFIGRNVKAQLERIVDSQGQLTNRDLLLSLSHMSIAQFIRHSIEPISLTEATDIVKWSQKGVPGALENIIFSLPSMDMRMVANEEREGGNLLLYYDFNSKFVRREGQQALDNINITFNLALYSWLTGLNKTFFRELKRAQEISELGQVPAPPAARKKPAEQVASPTDTEAEPLSIARPSTPLASAFPSKNSRQVPSAPSKTHVTEASSSTMAADAAVNKSSDITYMPRTRHIERLTVRQLGEATPDVMHPFFTKRAGFSLETALPQYVHEYATLPVEEIMKLLVKIYSKQLKTSKRRGDSYM